RNMHSPAFSDFGWAALLFLTYLTLKGWDIGAKSGSDDPASLQKIARVCAWWTLAAGAIVVMVRAWRFEDRWVILTAAALLHLTLVRVLGFSYLFAGLISLMAAMIIILATSLLGRTKRSAVA